MMELIQSIAQVLSIVAIPIVIHFVGVAVQKSIAERGSQDRMIELAVSILRSQPDSQSDSEVEPIRNWAIQVLSKYSPVPFTQSLEKGLQSQPLRTQPEQRHDPLAPRHIHTDTDFCSQSYMPSPENKTTPQSLAQSLIGSGCVHRIERSSRMDEHGDSYGWMFYTYPSYTSRDNMRCSHDSRVLIDWLKQQDPSLMIVQAIQSEGAWNVTQLTNDAKVITKLPIPECPGYFD